MNAILAIAAKDLRLLTRDKMGLFWVLAFPIIYAVFFGLIMGGGDGGRGGMSIAIFDDDHTDSSRSFVERLKKSESLRVTSLETPAAARNAVRTGNLVAYVVVQKGYGENQMALFGGSAPPLEVGMDPSRKAEAGMLQGVIMEASFKTMGEQFANPAKMRQTIAGVTRDLDKSSDLAAPQRMILKTFMSSLDRFLGDVDPDVYKNGPKFEGAKLTISAVDPGNQPRTAFELTFPSAIVWGIMGCVAAFAISLVRERNGGTLLRLRLAPISRTHVLAGKALACFLTCAAVILLVLLFGMIVFKVRLDHPLNLAVAILSTSVCFVGMMMLMSTIGKTEHAVSGAGWGINSVMAMIGGGMIPLFFMPEWMFKAASISPVKWSIVALEGAIWRDYSLGEMALPAGVLVCIGVVTFAAGAAIFRRTDS